MYIFRKICIDLTIKFSAFLFRNIELKYQTLSFKKYATLISQNYIDSDEIFS